MVEMVMKEPEKVTGMRLADRFEQAFAINFTEHTGVQSALVTLNPKDRAIQEHFLKICREKKGTQARTAKLVKGRFKAFLKERYKMNDKEFPRVGIAHKVAECFDWSTGSVVLDNYTAEINKWLSEDPPKTLTRLAFTIYDINNDKRVDELDLYSIIHFFETAGKPAKAEEVRQFEEQMLKQILQVKVNSQETLSLFTKAISHDIC